MICTEYEALLDLYVDGESTAEELLRVQKHLEECPHCRAYVDDAMAMRLAFPDVEETELPEGFHESVMARIAQSAPPAKKPAKGRWRRTLAPVAAACFAVLLLANRGGFLMGTAEESAAAPAAAPYAMDFTTGEEAAPAAPAGDGLTHDAAFSATAEAAPMERMAEAFSDQEPSACEEYTLVLTITAAEAEETGFFAGMEPMEWSDGSGGYLLHPEELEILLSLLPEAEPVDDLPTGQMVFVRIQD